MTQTLNISIERTAATAPNYGGDWKHIKLSAAIVIVEGTEAGLPTVDLQLTDQDGKKFIAMINGSLLDMLAGAVKGATQCEQEKQP